MHTQTLTLFLACAGSLIAQDTREAKIAWLAEHMATDLTGLGDMIGDAEVVFLGEASHGDGTTFERKVEITRHLHRELGFSVIVFESGFYECHKAWQEILASRDPEAAARDAIFTVWSKSAQVAPLWRYIGEQSRSEHPLELAGFDFQPSGVHTRDSLLDELVAAIGKDAEELLGMETWAGFSKPYELLRDGRGRELFTLDEDARLLFQDSSMEVADALDAEEPLLAQAVRSHAMYMRFTWGAIPPPKPGVFNLREVQGAENLQWMIDELYAGQKLIVWGATSHLSRNRQEIETDIAQAMIPFGHHVAKRMEGKVFMLGFVTHHGVSAIAREGAGASNIPAASMGSFADLLHAAGRGMGYVDLRAAAWLREKRVARMMGHSEMTADWSLIVDAICYVPEMKPSVLATSEEEGVSKRR